MPDPVRQNPAARPKNKRFGNRNDRDWKTKNPENRNDRQGRKEAAGVEMRKANRENIFVCAAFAFFFCFSCYKLTAAPLWYDEAIEFYFSKYLTGPIENVTDLGNLYERLVYYGFQPPLYNLVMWVWLLFGESELWFRFSCVVFAAGSAAGIFYTVKKENGRSAAAAAVFIYTLVYEIMYYFRECAEYALLLMFLTWTVYFFSRALEKCGNKELLIFTLLCVLGVYSQYGAVFIVVPMALGVLIEKWRKEKEKLKILLPAYAAAAVCGGFPLYWWFIRVQLSVQENHMIHSTVSFLKGNLFYDFFKNLSLTFSWCLIDNESIERFEILTALGLVGILVLSVFVVAFGKNRVLKHLIFVNAASWVLYYSLVKLNIYAYGGFGNRYNVFFVPVWFVSMVLIVCESGKIIKERFQKRYAAYALITVSLLASLFLAALNLRKMPHIFEKSHTREAVDVWYELEGYKAFTYVCFGENVSFEYYLTHHEEYEEGYKDRIFMETGNENVDTSEKEPEEYIAFVKEKCGGELPEQMFVSTGNRFGIVRALEGCGYQIDRVYETNTTLYHIYRDGQQ